MPCSKTINQAHIKGFRFGRRAINSLTSLSYLAGILIYKRMRKPWVGSALSTNMVKDSDKQTVEKWKFDWVFIGSGQLKTHLSEQFQLTL